MEPRYREPAITEATSAQQITRRTTTITAWTIWSISMILIALGFLFVILSGSRANFNERAILTIFSLYPTLGALIAWQRPHNPIGWLLSAMALSFAALASANAYATYALNATSGTFPAGLAMAWFQDWIWWVVLTLIPFVVLLFPNGHLPSFWWRYIMWAALINSGMLSLLSALHPHTLFGYPTLTNPLAIVGVWGNVLTIAYRISLFILFLTILLSIASLFLRFRRSAGQERQQLKWVFSGLVLLVLLFSAAGIFFGQVGPTNVLADMIEGIGWLSLPTTIAIAMLRHKLYDIDRLINRAIVYGLLTGILAVLYFGLVLGLQFLFDRVAGSAAATSPLILVGSTLIIAALFHPLRHRIQTIIDRRFYRSKYDARRTVANFSATLRGEVDLAQLSEQLVAIVEETMQPAHVSLWLNKAHQSRPVYFKPEDSPVSGVS